MSDMQMIVAVLKMQADLKSAMDEIHTLTNELQKRLGYLPESTPKKTIKLKKSKTPEITEVPEVSEVPKKVNRAILAWNAFRMEVKRELEISGLPITNKDVMRKAVEKKNEDPDGYIDFTNIWLATN